MRKTATAMTIGGTLMLSGVSGATIAHADEFSCQSALGAISVDNLRVPAGAKCTLTGTQLQGSLVVESGATLVANQVT
ncbi:MAG: hypothetical protein ACRC0L_12780, partial [Angustibacter sp.]